MFLALLTMNSSGVLADARIMKIVAFGTSLTARGGWQPVLEAELAKCLGYPVHVATVARTGATSDWALTMLDSVVAEAPHIVLIEFHVNDAALNRFMTVSHSRSNVARILDDLRRRLPKARLLLMAMNPVSGLRGLIRPFFDSYINAHRDMAQAKGAEFIDHRPGWFRLSDAELAAAIPDGSHPKPSAAAAVMVPEIVHKITGGKCQS